MNEKQIIISKSDLMAFLECPQKFKDLKEGKVKIEGYRVDIGSGFHLGVDWFWEHISIKDGVPVLPKLPSKDRLLKKLFNNFKEVVKLRWQECNGDLQKFYPIFTEEEFSANTKILDKDVILVGHIDMVDRDEEEGMVIPIEWKTGKVEHSHELEIIFYSYLLTLNNFKVRKGIIYYPFQNKVKIVEVNDEKINRLKKILESMVWHLENNLYYHRPNCGCKEEVKNVQ
ncbi:MAG: PD-(D/E)XK nuclease family protein [Candidatus Aenigmatarchaeota archaeon]